jgi:hypothetical protein
VFQSFNGASIKSRHKVSDHRKVRFHGWNSVVAEILCGKKSAEMTWETWGFQRYKLHKINYIRLRGGGWSLVRTVLLSEFPANREKYREISEIRFKSLPEQVYMMLNPREFVAMNLDF